MNLTIDKLHHAVRRSLYATASLALGLAGTGHAQNTPDQAVQPQLETVTVTGSRIRRADVETAQPIVIIDRAQIEHQGFSSVADILNNMPEAGSPPISRGAALAAGETVGGYFIDIRNLGPNRTLVLLNGKRLGAGTDGTQDLNQIPLSVIERIEVLKDGASTIYGSDAISGVVNIITRSHYDGIEVNLYGGQFSKDDGKSQQYDFTLGTHNDRGSVTLSASYSKDDPVWASNRDYSAYPNTSAHPTIGWTSANQYGSGLFPSGSCPGQAPGNPAQVVKARCTLNPGGNPLNPADYHGTNSAGGISDLSNSNEEMYAIAGSERHALFVSGDYALTDDIKFKTDILYNKRTTNQHVAGYPFQSAAFGTPLSKDSYFNPFGTQHGYASPTDINFIRRTWEVPRTTDSELSTYRWSAGLEGSFTLFGDRVWNWDAGMYVNTNDLVKINHGDLSLPQAAAALGPSFLDPTTGKVTCGTPDNPIPYGSAPGSCVPWNPFLPPGQKGQGMTGDPALDALLFPNYFSRGRTKSMDYSANITGTLFALPAGDWSVAAGIEHRNESGRFDPDAFSQSGLSTSLSSGPTSGSYKVDEVYLETQVPLLKEAPFAHSLSVNLASRYSRYDTFGSTTNSKFGLEWRATEDLLVRGNYAEGFRAPTISDLFGGQSGTFDPYTDPCGVAGSSGGNAATAARCTGGFGGQAKVPAGYVQIGSGGSPCTTYPCQTNVQFFSGSNPNLKAETATTKTAGLVYSPRFVEGLDFALDWYRVHIKNAISIDSAQAILDDCYLRGITSRCASSYFTRDPATGVVNFLAYGNTNQGFVDTEGYDFGVNYRVPELPFGRVVLHWNTTYVAHNNVKIDNDDATPVSVQNGSEGFARIRSVASVDWSLRDFGATWTTRYFSSQLAICSPTFPAECNEPDHIAPDTGPQPLNRAGATAFHDLQVRWTAPWRATISAGINNVFDRYGTPQYGYSSTSFKYNSLYDLGGRFYYVRYQQRF